MLNLLLVLLVKGLFFLSKVLVGQLGLSEFAL